MKFILIIFSFIMISNSFSQCDKNKKFDTSLFCKILSKKTDTIYFEATYVSIGKIAQSDFIEKLNSKRVINKKNYSTAITFIPFVSTQELYLPFNDFYNEKNYEKLREFTGKNQTICIRGIVNKDYQKWDNKIFFLVDKIDFINK